MTSEESKLIKLVLLDELDHKRHTPVEKAASLRRIACILLRLSNTLAPIPGAHFDPDNCARCGEPYHLKIGE